MNVPAVQSEEDFKIKFVYVQSIHMLSAEWADGCSADDFKFAILTSMFVDHTRLDRLDRSGNLGYSWEILNYHFIENILNFLSITQTWSCVWLSF